MCEIFSAITGFFSCLFGCFSVPQGQSFCVKQASYVCRLEENLRSLKTSMEDLKNKRNDVKARVDHAEVQNMTRTHEVAGWLQRVEVMERDVAEIMLKGWLRRVGGGCSRNCWTSYEFGREVVKKLAVVVELRSKGDFDAVADTSIPVRVQEMPEYPTVGMDPTVENVWNLLRRDHVRILGIFGMGGVGKTTLLNKINNKFLDRSTHNFDVVIWVVVSKEFNPEKIQNEILKRLGLPEQENENQRTRTIFNILSKKKFMVLLDDIWKRVDLLCIGIPLPNTHNHSKVVFTARSEAVCRQMEAHEIFKVECLDQDKAWSLFQRKVEHVELLNSDPEMLKLAKEVAKECHGLPLALNVIGRTMATKKTEEEWKYALKMLRKSATEFSGMTEEVFSILKFSYDNLQNDAIRSCFLCCSLYPEDSIIHKHELIEHWMGEGFLDEYEHVEDARYKGFDVIESLKVVCLLEGGHDEELYVKMHDVVRDLALWIACECGKKIGKVFVQSGVGLTKAPGVENWRIAQRISLVNIEIEELPRKPECIDLSTLLLQGLRSYITPSKAPTDFFDSMPTLRVLNMSRIGIEELPKSIGKLVKLQYLNLSWTRIQSLPGEFNNLVNLKYLILGGTSELKKIQYGLISQFSKLQMLNLFDSCGDWSIESSGNDSCNASLAELESLEHLSDLQITITEDHALQSLCNSRKLQRSLTGICVGDSQSLIEVTVAPSSMASALFSLHHMNKLRYLRIQNCPNMEKIEMHWVAEEGLLCNLEQLFLFDLPNMEKIGLPSRCFKKLYWIRISGCHGLKDLRWLIQVPHLKFLLVADCKEIQEIIIDGFAHENQTLFSKLRTLQLLNLPKLKSICMYPLPFPHLETIRVHDCPLLKMLPLDSNSAENTLRWILGSRKWWEELQWENETIKTSFQPYFIEERMYFARI